MGRVALNIIDAAKSSGTKPHEIIRAINALELKAHRIDGHAIILCTDLATWVDGQPNWYPVRSGDAPV